VTTPEQRKFLDEWEQTLDKHAGEVAVEAERLIQKTAELAERLRLSDANSVYDRVQRTADAIVQKSGMSPAEARVEALRRNPTWYQEYVSGLEKAWAEDPLGQVDQRHAARDLVSWAQRRLASAADAGARQEILAELASHPQMRDALQIIRDDDARKAREQEKRERQERKEAAVQKAAIDNYPVDPLPEVQVDGEWPLTWNSD
jgi:hypothetical protein